MNTLANYLMLNTGLIWSTFGILYALGVWFNRDDSDAAMACSACAASVCISFLIDHAAYGLDMGIFSHGASGSDSAYLISAVFDFMFGSLILIIPYRKKVLANVSIIFLLSAICSAAWYIFQANGIYISNILYLLVMVFLNILCIVYLFVLSDGMEYLRSVRHRVSFFTKLVLFESKFTSGYKVNRKDYRKEPIQTIWKEF